MRKGIEKIKLEVREDQATGEIGLCLAELNELEEPSMANDGYLIAHDIIEHVNGVGEIGGIAEELQAMGAIWNTRGQWGDIRRDGIGARFSPQQNIAFDIKMMWRDYIYGEDMDCDTPQGPNHIMRDEFQGILELAEATIHEEIDCPMNKVLEERYEEYKSAVVNLMIEGYDKSVEMYGDSTHSNSLFYAIEEALRNEVFTTGLTEGDKYIMTVNFETAKVEVNQAYECIDCGDSYEVEYDLHVEHCECCLSNYMTAEQVQESFNDTVMSWLDQEDIPMVNEAFNNYTDSLCKDGQITEYMYNNIVYDNETMTASI